MTIRNTITALVACSSLLATVKAANVAINNGTLTTSLNVAGPNDYYQSAGGTLDVNSGGSITVSNPRFESIFMQDAAGTSIININTGGSLDFSGATGFGTTLFLGNNRLTAIAIINVQGGIFDGSGLTNIIFGRDNGIGQMNISSGSVILGDSTPLFDTNGGGTPVESTRTNSYINFADGSTGTLAITGATLTTYQNWWNTGDLRFGGNNTGTFDEHFIVSGNVLSVVPEPSMALLSGVGLIGLLRRRR